MSAPTPPPWAGCWTRRLLRVPGEADDTSTAVTWLQAGQQFVDLRQPAGRPSFSGAGSLRDCTTAQLHWLSRQQAFAGRLEVYGAVYRWQREIEFGVPMAGVDAGHMQRVDGLWHETGIFAEYLEHWALTPWQGGPCVSRKFLLVGDGQPPRAGLLCVVGADWMLAIDGALPAHHRHGVALTAALDGEFSLGRIHAGAARIERSTLPWREGLTLPFEAAAPLAFVQHHPALAGLTLHWDEVSPA